MLKPRRPEPHNGNFVERNVHLFDQMQRRLRDKNWLQTMEIIRNGLDNGLALEIGPGPGYLGLEWLNETENSRLIGLDHSLVMIKAARRNALEYGFNQARYVLGSGESIPFRENTFDGVISANSLHEWVDPVVIFNEIRRILKPGGRFVLLDLRRDMPDSIKDLLLEEIVPEGIHSNFTDSIDASYTPAELEALIQSTQISAIQIKSHAVGLILTGIKERQIVYPIK